MTTPDNPDDIEFVALTLIKRSTSGLTLSGASLEAFVHMLRAVVSALGAERAFASLSWPDAEQVADAITSTLIDHAADAADAAENLRQRTRDALAGTDGIVWNDREAAARALNIAASGALRAREDYGGSFYTAAGTRPRPEPASRASSSHDVRQMSHGPDPSPPRSSS